MVQLKICQFLLIINEWQNIETGRLKNGIITILSTTGQQYTKTTLSQLL